MPEPIEALISLNEEQIEEVLCHLTSLELGTILGKFFYDTTDTIDEAGQEMATLIETMLRETASRFDEESH